MTNGLKERLNNTDAKDPRLTMDNLESKKKNNKKERKEKKVVELEDD